MADIWEQVAPQQRLSELLKLLKEQKEKEQEHDTREDDRRMKSEDRDAQLAELIEILGKHMLELERRVTELEKKNSP
jgi:acyl-homoserine lactone acylase PvdQ